MRVDILNFVALESCIYYFHSGGIRSASTLVLCTSGRISAHLINYLCEIIGIKKRLVVIDFAITNSTFKIDERDGLLHAPVTMSKRIYLSKSQSLECLRHTIDLAAVLRASAQKHTQRPSTNHNARIQNFQDRPFRFDSLRLCYSRLSGTYAHTKRTSHYDVPLEWYNNNQPLS